MKKKFAVPFVLLGFSMATYAQPGDKKTDTVKPAKEIISKNSGEKNFLQQLKENQLKEHLVILNSDSSNTSKANHKRTKGIHNKHSKKKRS